MEADGRFKACLAGHPPILHVRGDGDIAEHIGSGSYPLGIRLSLCWRVEEGALEKGDSLVLYSDGLVEARGAEDLEYGYERAERLFSSWHRASANGLLSAVIADWNGHTDGRPIDDDVSVAVIHRRIA